MIWNGKESSHSSLGKSLEKFEGATIKGKPDFAAMIRRLSNRADLKNLGRLVDSVLKANPSEMADQLVSTKLASALGLSKAELTKLYKSGNPIVDLRSRSLGSQLSGLLGKLAQGNEGKTKIAKLQFNLNTYEIYAEVSLQHRHSWGNLSDILAAVGKKIGQWADKAGNYVSQRLDSAGNLVRESVIKGADRTVEQFNKAGELFSRKIFNNAGVLTKEISWEKGVKTLEKIRDSAGNMVSNFWRDGSKEINQWFSHGKLSAETVVQNGVKIVDQAWKDGVKTLDRVRNESGQLISEYWREGSKEFQNLYTKGVKTAYTAWEKNKVMVNVAWNKAGERVSVFP